MIQIFNPFLLSLVFLKMKHSKSSNFSQCSVSPGNCSFIIGNIKLTSSPFQPYSPNNKKKEKGRQLGFQRGVERPIILDYSLLYTSHYTWLSLKILTWEGFCQASIPDSALTHILDIYII